MTFKDFSLAGHYTYLSYFCF